MPTTTFATQNSPINLALLDAALLEAARGSPYLPYTINEKATTPYVLTLIDATPNSVLRMNLAGANAVTIPLNSSVAFAIGDRVIVEQWGVGVTTISGAGGVTLRPGAAVAIPAQYGRLMLEKVATNEWNAIAYSGAAGSGGGGSSSTGNATVRAATVGNITIATALNAGDVIDSVVLVDNDLVLVKNQTSGASNGIIVVGVVPARSALFNTYNKHSGVLITVQEGTQADTIWLCTSNQGGTLDSTAIAFAQLVAGGGGMQGSNNLSEITNAQTARTNIGLGNVNNTADASKPVSTLQAQAISDAVAATPAQVLLGAGTTVLTRATHVNRSVVVNQAGNTVGTFAATAISGAVGGDYIYVRNVGAGTFAASGAITAAPGYKLLAPTGEVFTADYNSITDSWNSTTTVTAVDPLPWIASSTLSTLAYSSTVTINGSLHTNHINVGLLTGNVTIGNPINFSGATTLNVWLTQDAVGSRTIALDTKLRVPGGATLVLSTAANAVDLLRMVYNPLKDIWMVTLATESAPPVAPPPSSGGLVLDLDLSTTLPAQLSFSRIGTRNAIVNGVIVSVATGIPAFESWDGIPRGMSVEATPGLGSISQNLTHSNDPADASWTKNEVTASTGGTGPDGVGASVTAIAETTTALSNHWAKKNSSSSISAGTTQTCFTIVKRLGTSTRWAVRLRMSDLFNNGGLLGYFMINGTPGFFINTDTTVLTSPSAGVRKLANGFYLLWVTGTWVNTGTKEYDIWDIVQDGAPNGSIDGNYTGVVTEGFETYGLQAITGSRPTGWVTTTTTALTQPVETAIFNTLSWFNSGAGTFIVEHDCTTGVLIGSGATAILTATVAGKTAIAYSGTGTDIVNNGGAATNSGTPLAFGADMRLLGTNAVGNIGHIKSIKFYDSRLSVASMQSLTAPTTTSTSSPGVLRAMSTENRLPSALFTTSGTQLNFFSRYRLNMAGSAASELRLDFANFCFGTAAPGNAVVVDECYLERVLVPESRQVLFSGGATKTLADGAANQLSDAILPTAFTGLSQFPANMELWVRVRGHVTTAGHKIPLARARGEANSPQAYVYDTGTITNMSGTGQLNLVGGSLTAMSSLGFCPILVGRFAAGDPKSLFIMGDSLVEGVGSIFTNRSFIPRAAAASGFAIIEFSLGGMSQSTVSESSYWKGYLSYCRMFVDQFGLNNQNLRLHFFSLWKSAKDAAMGKTMHWGLSPRSTSTDLWATEANQTISIPYPSVTGIDAMLSSAAAYGFVDSLFVPLSIKGVNLAKWKVDGTAQKYTSDGTHPTQLSDDLMSAEYKVIIDALAVP